MGDQVEKPPHFTQAQWNAVDVPELTDDELARARPLRIVQPDLYQAWKRSRGRPIINGHARKHIGFRFAADLEDGLKASGKDYNARVEAVLRDAMSKGAL